MIRLKLFEDFEEKSFYKINAEELLSAIKYSIPYDEYPFSNLDNRLKSRLSIIFGHSDFYYEKENKNDKDSTEWIYIYERLHSLVRYKIFLTEDEWFYLESHNRAVGSPPGFIHYYKCDDIKGVSDAIKYDYEEINERVTLYYKLPTRQGIYGTEGVKKQFFGAEPILLDTHKRFPISDFPEQEVSRIIPDVYLPNDYDWGPFRRKEFLDLKVDGKMAKLTWNNKTIDLYYIKETNRFICAVLANWDYWACLGAEGLKTFLNVFFFRDK